ncbi:MAG TPA: dihydrodipicolinate synthase family protein [Vicinamibacteria bacterium]|nr:dihydrodipicolinate synthase family protein [Vicinamibacteria bacterium]
MPTQLSGIIVPLITPFRDDDSVDHGVLAALAAHLVSDEVDGLMATALTGEGLLLEESETLAVWDTVIEAAAGRVPVVPAILSATTRKAMELARAAEARGAAAIMAAPILSELYSGRSHDDVIGFYADLGASTSLPIVLFNYPSLTGVDLAPSLLARLAEIVPVRYVKESTGDASRVHQIHREVGDRLRVICGAPSTALESFALGVDTWITGILNIVPRSGKELLHAVIAQCDLVLARRIYYEEILPLWDLLRSSSNPTGVIKAGVSAWGLDVGSPRRPGQSLDDEHRARVAAFVAALKSRSR